MRRDADAGKFQVAIADDPAGPWTAARDRAGRLRVDGGVRRRSGRSRRRVHVARREAGALLGDGQEPRQRRATSCTSTTSRRRRRTGACPVADVAAGGNHTCALMSGGGVRCWGANASGQLGDGSGADRAQPARRRRRCRASPPSRPAPRTPARCPPTASVRCWGGNANGQLGDGTTTDARDAARRPGAFGREGDRGGPRAHLRAHDQRRRSLLGRQRRPASSATARRPTACGRPTTDVLLGREGDRRRRRAHLRADDDGRRALLGRERPRPARRRYDGRPSSTPPASDVVGDIAAVSAGDNAHLRAHQRGRRPLLGPQHRRRARRSAPSIRSLSPPDHGRALRRQAGRRQLPVHLRAADERRRPLLGLQRRRRDRRRHGAAGRSPEPRGRRRPRRRGEPRRGVRARLRAHDERRRPLLGRQRCRAARRRHGARSSPFTPPTMDTPGFNGTCE